MQALILALALLATAVGSTTDLFQALADRIVMYDGLNPPPKP